jgi:hypothetical protein
MGVWVLALLAGFASAAAHAETSRSGLLFHVSADRTLEADQAAGDASPNFLSGVHVVANGKFGGAAQWDDDGVVTWNAPKNIYARRGTLSFFWRSRTPVGTAPFNIFRVGFADHSSWDMAFLRIDWNGHGFDAFVTDTNLARIRVSYRMNTLPAADTWQHIAFAWDETSGVSLFVDSHEVARKDQQADLDSGLDQFGLAGRVVSPHQVQSRYHFMRGSDIDELRIYDHRISASDAVALAANREPANNDMNNPAAIRQAWLHRYGWDTSSPPLLTAESTQIRKIEFSTARDLKEEMRKGIDGIDETTWPGVYNRSRLPGRDDYFELPDWNVYVDGGNNYDLTIPAAEAFNRVEIRGAAYGSLSYAANVSEANANHYSLLSQRRQGAVHSIHSFDEHIGGVLRFANAAQETPIQEIWAYDVKPGAEPKGTFKLAYQVNADAAPAFANLHTLVDFIDGRYPPEERTTVVALPAGARATPAAAGNAASVVAAARSEGGAPIVHILIPSGFGDALPARPLARAWNYGWENVHDGLDGIAIDIPALKVMPNAAGLIPLNIRVKDPIWPARDMIDVSVSVRAGEPRTVWLDLRDRILSNDSLYLSVASAAADFGAKSINGMNIRLVFKEREQARLEHVIDRFNQVKDNWGFLVEEHTASKREALYRRVYADISDLLRVDPDHAQGRMYWQDMSYYAQSTPPFTQPSPPPGVPLWAFRQLEDLQLVHRFVDWWIDNRQVPYGDFGGGISDDTDLVQQWPGLALMGVDPDKINASLRALSDAAYKNGMVVNGLSYITTDELHVYEEGLNSDAERLYLNWGEPKAVERLMATTKALQSVIITNPAGHLHFASNWYGGRTMYREGPWEWQKPYSFVVMHAPILMGVYNANPVATGLVTGVVDGLLAHGKQRADGNWSFPNEINWRTDAERAGDGGGASTPLQSAWAAYRFSGDEKYLRPLMSRVTTSGPGVIAEINENVLDALNHGADWGTALSTQAKKSSSEFDRYTAWQISADKHWLEALHADAIREKSQRMYMVTEGHWWSDRVEQPSEILQRERLGGVALKRNWTYPGHTVSWRFANTNAAEKVAILLPGATRDHFKVIAYNSSDQPQRATMTTWNVTAGQWQLVTGIDTQGDDQADAQVVESSLPLERSRATEVSFAPHATTIMEFSLLAPVTPTESRADLGIGVDDVHIVGKNVAVTVHSLGAMDTQGGIATLQDKQGNVLATASIPAMLAPRDLVPRTASVHLLLPVRAGITGLSIHVALSNNEPEVTMLNNVVRLSELAQ